MNYIRQKEYGMERQSRQRYTGLTFFIVLVLLLLSTRTPCENATENESCGEESVVESIKEFFREDSDNSINVVLAVLSLGVVFFTSDAIGFLFSTITYFYLNSRKNSRVPQFGFYATEFNNFHYDLKTGVIKRIKTLKKYEPYTKPLSVSYFAKKILTRKSLGMIIALTCFSPSSGYKSTN
jgi:hypothetical protein